MWLDRSDVQGLVVSGYAARPSSALLTLRLGSGRPHAWLRRLIPQVSSASRRERHEPYRVNVAFSATGLRALGLDEASLLGFSEEFREGMAARARLLGDVGEDAPEHWVFGNGARPVDAVVLVYAASAERLETKLDELTDTIEACELDYEEFPTYLDAEQREHFGFRFAVSAPRFRRSLSPGRSPRVPLGELLLGHQNLAGERRRTPTAPYKSSTRAPRFHSRERVDLGHNGTYLVLRRLEQRVAAFWAALDKLARNTGERFGDAEALAACLVGRSPDGAALSRCPLGAHVKRVGPHELLGLDARAHRLVRRGRLYGPRTGPIQIDDGVPRGLMFVALNADLGDQFEFLQQNFVNDPKFAGLRNERDPLVGQDQGPRRITLQDESVRSALGLGRRAVRLTGGGYFFLPSLSALGYLSDAGPESGK